ncbi:MAG: ComEC/Rec2 family competence protein [Phycisphaerales bacterium]
MRASWTRPGDWSDGEALAARVRAGVALGAVAAGITLGRYTPGAAIGVWFALALGASGLACVGRGWVCRVALVVVVALLAAGWTQARVHTRAPLSLERWLPGGIGGVSPRVIVRLECRALSATVRPGSERTPLDAPFGEETPPSIEVEALRVETSEGWAPATGLVVVRAPGLRNEDYTPGGRVLVTGWGVRIGAGSNPGNEGWPGRARQRGEVGSIFLTSPELIQPVEEGWLSYAWATPTRWRGLVRRRAAAAMGESEGEGAALMGALLLGKRDPTMAPIATRFRQLGASHLLAVSGFHLAVLAGLALWFARLFGERGRLESALVGGATFVYMLVLPTRTPITRAGVMVLGVLGGEALARRPDRLASLAWIAIGLLAWRPLDLWSIGFQLSVGITGLLIWLGSVRHPWVFGAPRVVGAGADVGVWRGAGRVVWRTFVGCVLCWVIAAPTILTHTGVASPIAPIASTLLLPFVLFDLAAGFVVVIAGSVVPSVSGVGSHVFAALGDGTLWVASVLERVPGATYALPAVSSVWAVAATAWGIWMIKRARVRDPLVWGVGVALGVWLAAEVMLGPRLTDRVVLRVDTLDVEDGTCHLVRSGDEALLWDAGSLSRPWAEGSIERAWRALGGAPVRTAIVSHPNLDHYNALPALAQPLGLRRVLVSDAMLEQMDQGVPAFWRQRLEAQGVRIERLSVGDEVTLGRATIRILSDGSGGGELELNDRSLVARLEAPTERGVRRVLMTGDIEAPGMELLESRGADVRADVLELPHHGSVHATALDFVARVDPAIVVQSTGPSRALDERWASVREGRVWWTTAVEGAAWVEVRRDGSLETGAMVESGVWDYRRPAR